MKNDITRLLKASIAREENKKQMEALNVDPRLSEFSEEELLVSAAALGAKIEELQKHIRSLTQTAEMERMFRDEVIKWWKEIDHLEIVRTQFTNARLRKNRENQIASN